MVRIDQSREKCGRSLNERHIDRYLEFLRKWVDRGKTHCKCKDGRERGGADEGGGEERKGGGRRGREEKQ